MSKKGTIDGIANVSLDGIANYILSMQVVFNLVPPAERAEYFDNVVVGYLRMQSYAIAEVAGIEAAREWYDKAYDKARRTFVWHIINTVRHNKEYDWYE